MANHFMTARITAGHRRFLARSNAPITTSAARVWLIMTQTQRTTRQATSAPLATVTTDLVAACGGLARRPHMVKRIGCALLLVFGVLYGVSQVAAYPLGPSASDDLYTPPVELPEVR